jgi:hypothetical protein
MGVLLASLLFFLLLHAAVARRRRRPFHVDLRLSRGVASLLLVAAGVYALIRWFPLWPQGFLAANDEVSAAVLIAFLGGHLLADLVWLAWGALRFGSAPRPDLVVHHLLGLAGCLCAAFLGVGYVLIAVVLTSEAMPVATGLGAWAGLAGNNRLELLAMRLQVLVLVLWRLPLWLFLLTALAASWARGTLPGPPPTPAIAAAAFAFVAALDVYWTGECLAAEKELRAEAAKGDTIPALRREPTHGRST